MMTRLKADTLPSSLRDASKAIGKTYPTTRKAAQESDALKTHFKLRGPTTTANGNVLEELTRQADVKTRKYLNSLSPDKRTDLEDQLRKRSPDDRLKLLKTLADDPDSGSCGDAHLRRDE